MSYAGARAQIVTAIESATPSVITHGLGSAFVHEPGGSEARSTAARRFWIVAIEGVGSFGAMNQQNSRRRVAELEVWVRYGAFSDQAALDGARVADLEAITDALLNTTNWGQPSSTIVALATVDGLSAIDWRIEPLDPGSALVLTFPLHYSHA